MRRCNRRKTTNGSRSCASDGSWGRSIFVPSSRHRWKSRPRGHECAALRGAVVDSPALSSVRQEDGCTGESMLPPNTDDGNCVGPHGPSRRSGRSRCMSSSIGRPVQNCAPYPQLATQNTEGSAAYPQLAKQTLALCTSGVQPEMCPSVAGASNQGKECVAACPQLAGTIKSPMAKCGGAAGQLRASARRAVKVL